MKVTVKNKIITETRLLLILTAYLTLFFCSISVYTRLVLGLDPVSYVHWGYNLIESLILAKIILLGRMLNLGERFLDKPLVFTCLYKALIFCFFVFAFDCVEHFVIGSIEGKPLKEIYAHLTSQGITVLLGKIPLSFTVFFLFFCFLELDRVLGENGVWNLLFKKHS